MPDPAPAESAAPADVVSGPARSLLITAGVGAVALVAAGLLIHGTPDGAVSAVGVVCPFRELTGLPCPLCGATRSLGLLARGDGSFLDYNPVWAVVVVVGIPVTLLLALRPAWRARWARVPLSVRLGFAVTVTVAAWAVVLTHRAAIVTG